MNHVEFRLPKMAETLDSATVAVWHKHPGDRIQLGETLLEIETDKFSYSLESPIDGEVVELMVLEGQEVPVGTVLAILGAA